MAKRRAPTREYRVSGRVTYAESGNPALGMRVRAMDADFLFDDVLGEAVTDVRGEFSITFGVERFRDLFERAPDIFLLVHDADGRPLATTRDAVEMRGRRSRSSFKCPALARDARARRSTSVGPRST